MGKDASSAKGMRPQRRMELNGFTNIGMVAFADLLGYCPVQRWFDHKTGNTTVLGILRSSTGESMAVQSLHDALRGDLAHAGNAAPWELHPAYATV